MKCAKEVFRSFLIFIVGLPFLGSLLFFLLAIQNYVAAANGWGTCLSVFAIVLGTYLLRSKLTKETVYMLACWLLLALAGTIVFMVLGKGGFDTQWMMWFPAITFSSFLANILLAIGGEIGMSVFYGLFTIAASLVSSFLFLQKESLPKKVVISYCSVALVFASTIGIGYQNRPEKKYAGHGFSYMYGLSSTDFSAYHVYSEPSKLAVLEKPAQLTITKDYPVMDGAEACYPLYAAFAKAVYADIAEIEEAEQETDAKYTNGKYVSFTNTIYGFERLLNGEVDLLFGARPSAQQMELTEEMGVSLTVTPIGKEGFVFFVEDANPVQNLTSEQIRSIYHGDITNWQQVGGNKSEIRAFQRPENSGSQTMMQYFMQDVSLKEPLQYERVSSMGGVIQEVAQYANEEGAMGYTFRYFLEELHQEKHVKMLSVDGAAPTRENISNGTYPLTVDLCVITLEDPKNPNVSAMLDFILSEQGQELVEKTGYGRLSSDNP